MYANLKVQAGANLEMQVGAHLQIQVGAPHLSNILSKEAQCDKLCMDMCFEIAIQIFENGHT